MKTTTVFLTAIIALIGLSFVTTPSVMAQSPQGNGGYSADHDGDGIPNCQDADYIKNPKDGTGYQHGKMLQGQKQRAGQGKSGDQPRYNNRNRNRVQTENSYKNCLGLFGFKFGWGNGTGVCDGTGPHGFRSGRK